MRTVIFSGSFDPIHVGHAMVASYVAQTGVADELWLMPSRINPLKQDTPPASGNHRLEMCRLVADKIDRVDISDVELSLSSPSYTYRTLCHLRDRYPDRSFSILIGSDNWLCFDKWRDHDRIISDFGVLVYPRPGYGIDPETIPDNVELLPDAPQTLISSTFLRGWIGRRRNVNFMIPDDVINYIKTHRLYE